MNKLLFDLDFTLLEKKDLFGKDRLRIFEKYGTTAAITDFAIFLGGKYNSNFHTKEGNDLKDRTGSYFLMPPIGFNGINITIIDRSGKATRDYTSMYTICARPIIPYSSISNYISNEKTNSFGIKEVEFGEYPQNVADLVTINKLDMLYENGMLDETGKSYNGKYHEYEYDGEKYIRVLGNYNSRDKLLSNGQIVKLGHSYWLKVEPIIWMIDEKKNKAVSKKLLFSGVRYCDRNDEYYFDFRKDIIPSNNIITYYLVRFPDNPYSFIAYKKDDILRELYTNIALVPEDANFIKEDTLCYNEIVKISTCEKKILEKDTKKYLIHLKEACKHSKNKEILYKKFLIGCAKKKLENTLSLKLK